MLREFIHQVISKGKKPDIGRSPTAVKVGLVVPKCLVCGKNTIGHRFAEIGCTVISDDNRLRAQLLYKHIERHEWSELAGFRDFTRNWIVWLYTRSRDHM